MNITYKTTKQNLGIFFVVTEHHVWIFKWLQHPFFAFSIVDLILTKSYNKYIIYCKIFKTGFHALFSAPNFRIQSYLLLPFFGRNFFNNMLNIIYSSISGKSRMKAWEIKSPFQKLKLFNYHFLSSIWYIMIFL